MGAAEVEAFLSWLATERNVAAATQNQALSALLFLYKELLGQDLPWFKDMVRAQRPVRKPVVLTRAEVQRLLAQMDGTKWLMASLLYGAGLRQIECLQLCVMNICRRTAAYVTGYVSRQRAGAGYGWCCSPTARQCKCFLRPGL